MNTTCFLSFLQLKPIFHYDAKPFALGTFASANAKDTNMLVSFADANYSRHPKQNPNASQWNIGCVGSQTQISCVGHVHFFFLCRFLFPVEYGLKIFNIEYL